MIEQTHYVATWLGIFVILGAIWYVLDRTVGIRLYRWYYDMTHRDPLPAGETRGFIYNRRARARCAAASSLALLQSVLAVLSGNVNPFVELITFFLEVPVLMVGFYLGPLLYRVWRRKDVLLDKMDEIESGETTVSEEIREVSHRAAEAVRETLLPEDTPEAEELPALTEQPIENKEPNEAPTARLPVDSPRKLMNQYLKRERPEQNDE